MSTSYRLRDGRDGSLFVLLGGSLAAAGASTREEGKADAPTVPYYAGDIRLSGVVGKTFFNALSTYVVARAFGGPIFWALEGKDVTGTDRYHFQLGVGLSASVPLGLDVFAELVPLGERAMTVGAGFSF